MAQDDGQERNQAPTPKRLAEARQKGQVPRSRELNTSVLLLFAAAALLAFGDWIMGRLVIVVSHGLAIDPAATRDPSAMLRALTEALIQALLLASPFLAVTLVAAVVGPVLVGGWALSAQGIAFNPTRLNPVTGLKRVFSWQGLLELFKALAKFLLIASVAIGLIWLLSGRILGLGDEPFEQAMSHAGSLIAWAFLVLAASTLLIAAIDVPFQVWFHQRQLRMTRQEVRDELKDTEGKPEVKGRIRKMQMEASRRRMMAAVPKADVVITNPTHFAIALAYDDRKMRAPRVVAKGADLVAAQIRGIAARSEVTLVEAPRLARALYYTVELEQEVPAGLYLAVAQVLAYVYQLKAARRAGSEPPRAPGEVPVPDEFLARERAGVKATASAET